MISNSSIAARVLQGDLAPTLPDEARAAVAVRLSDAHQAAFNAEQARLVGLCADAAYNYGNEGAIRAILTRAFGTKFDAQEGPTSGFTIRPLRSKVEVEDYVGADPQAQSAH